MRNLILLMLGLLLINVSYAMEPFSLSGTTAQDTQVIFGGSEDPVNEVYSDPRRELAAMSSGAKSLGPHDEMDGNKTNCYLKNKPYNGGTGSDSGFGPGAEVR